MKKKKTKKQQNFNSESSAIITSIPKNLYIKWIRSKEPIIVIILFLIILLLFVITNIKLNKIENKLNLKQNQNISIQNNEKKIIFLGDSLTNGYNLTKYFDDKNMINKGISGDTTLKVLDRLQTSIFDYNVKTVIILIGTNDIPKKIDLTENIELIINRIQHYDHHIKIIVQSLYPVNRTDNPKINLGLLKNRTNEKIKQENEKLKKICKKKKVIYLDVYHSLIDDKGNLKLDYTIDGLHLTDAGYTKVTNIIAPYVQ